MIGLLYIQGYIHYTTSQLVKDLSYITFEYAILGFCGQNLLTLLGLFNKYMKCNHRSYFANRVNKSYISQHIHLRRHTWTIQVSTDQNIPQFLEVRLFNHLIARYSFCNPKCFAKIMRTSIPSPNSKDTLSNQFFIVTAIIDQHFTVAS